MLINTVEVNAAAALLAFIKDINTQAGSVWSVLLLERSALKSSDTAAFTLAIKPGLEDASSAKLYITEKSAYIVWSGMHSKIEKALRDLIAPLLIDDADIAEVLQYIDPIASATELSLRLTKEQAETTSQKVPDKMNITEKADFSMIHLSALDYKALLEKKRDYRRLQILVIEDHNFLRQLMYETLRNDYDVHMAASVKEGLELYLKVAPHIVFLDIGLPDASGHTLAKKLKELDATSYVVMVTGNRQLEDVEAARENGVHGFIVKPFSKAKIEESIERYTASHQTPGSSNRG